MAIRAQSLSRHIHARHGINSSGPRKLRVQRRLFGRQPLRLGEDVSAVTTLRGGQGTTGNNGGSPIQGSLDDHGWRGACDADDNGRGGGNGCFLGGLDGELEFADDLEVGVVRLNDNCPLP